MKKLAFESLLPILALIVLLSYSACDSVDPATIVDEHNPEVHMSSPKVVEPGVWNHVKSSEVLPIDIRFEDDVELSHYEIRIEANDSMNYWKTASDPWQWTKQGFLSGKSDGINTSVQLGNDPDGGAYDFTVTVWDKSNKMTVFTTWLDMNNVRDTMGPSISVTAPTIGATVNNGSSIQVTADLSSVDEIETARARLYDPETKTPVGNSTKIYTNIFATSYQLTAIISNYDNVPNGDYEVQVFGADSYNNVTRVAIPVTLE